MISKARIKIGLQLLPAPLLRDQELKVTGKRENPVPLGLMSGRGQPNLNENAGCVQVKELAGLLLLLVAIGLFDRLLAFVTDRDELGKGTAELNSRRLNWTPAASDRFDWRARGEYRAKIHASVEFRDWLSMEASGSPDRFGALIGSALPEGRW